MYSLFYKKSTIKNDKMNPITRVLTLVFAFNILIMVYKQPCYLVKPAHYVNKICLFERNFFLTHF